MRIFGFVLALSMLCVAPQAEAAKAYGATILDESKKIGPGQFQSRRNWDRTLRFFRRVYPNSKKGIVWSRINARPGVKGIHIANIKRGRSWDGINIYEYKRRIYITVLEHKPES